MSGRDPKRVGLLMVSFSWTMLEDGTVDVQIRTPVTRIGTLHRLTAAIFVLGLDIVSGDVDTLEENGETFSQDRFILQRSSRLSSDRSMAEYSAQLGFLMETLLSREIDPDEILKEKNISPPEKSLFFDTEPELVFQDHEESGYTQFYIETINRTGLLFHLTRTIFHEGLNIFRATIRTTSYGSAEDTFFLQYNDGILGPEISKHLEEQILRG